MEFRRFTHPFVLIREFVLIPARVFRHARTTTVRIIGWQPTLNRLHSTWRSIEQAGFT